MRIGLYGGTFDPVHTGHLILARDAMEQELLDMVFFIPCAQSPHKSDDPAASGADRLAMLVAATEGQPGMQVSDIELTRGAPSYAADTVDYFRNRFRNSVFYWLLGTDQKDKLPTWHRYSELCQMVRFLYLPRGGRGRGTVSRRIDISATEIRARAASGLPVTHLVPVAVEAIISKRKIYR